VPARRTTYAFGLRYGGRSSVALYALPWQGPARELCDLPLAHPVMLHDFMATADHLVLLVSPLRLVLYRAILALGPFTRLFRWHPEDGTEVIVVPIDEPSRVRRFRVDPFFQIHFAGGFEDGDDTVVDVMAYADSSALDRNVAEIDRPPEAGVLTRIRIPRGAERIEKERLAKTPLEFGLVDPRFAGGRHRHVFGLTVDDTRFGLAHVDLERGEEHCHWFPDGEFAGEGLFVPERPDAPEGHGHILSLVYRPAAHETHLAVLDTRRLEAGPIARAHFDHHIPAGFHGTWVPAEPGGAPA
jgi:all-trans-8'-apo-beta-carotenal 15,15'-oxygenase